ncbi:MAG: alkaline phosphatase family protein [Lachnospiraceae bacterium]|nr:alkaline phosphatase family protein [Lachnospiraceae bacterium]
MKPSKKRARKIHKDHRLIIVSLDAVGSEDLTFLKTLPNFKSLYQNAAVCEHVESVCPSITYPAHTSIVTGKKPIHHGVINNTLVQPKRPAPDWMWQRKYVKGTTLYDETNKKGYKTAALLWPVTARSRIHYNLPEVLANRPWQNQIMVSAFNGTMSYELALLKRFGHLRDGVRQPALDNFVHQSALYTIKNYRPDMMLIHYTDVDTNRHIYGVHHQKARAALGRHDQRLGELFTALEETGDMDKTTLVVLGDHYQMDVERVVYFNYLFKEQGFLKTKGQKITDYQFLAKNCDGTCYIYANEKKRPNKEAYEKLTALLEKCKTQEIYGIERIYTGREAGEKGADDRCVYFIEAKKGVYYLDEFEALTLSVKDVKKGKMRGSHGYLPEKEGYQTFFLAKGYGIRENVSIPHMYLWDEGVTLAKLLQVDLGEVDGRVVKEILK